MDQQNTLANIFFGGGSFLSNKARMLTSLVPVVIMGLGGRYVHDCPKEPLIPIYLLVGGGASLLLQLLPFAYCKGPNGKPRALCRISNFLLYLFCLAWFIAGSVLVYQAYIPDFESEHSPMYCERILYLVTMWLTCAYYIFIVIFIIYKIAKYIHEEYFE